MPRRNDLTKIMIIGSGPIVIGQASEFDYSGTQALKALKEEGYIVVLVNSNPATIMTDPGLADAVYVEPITLPFLTKVIEVERPDAILPTVGGQTALNAALELYHEGILEKYSVELIGAKADAIAKAEDRKLFKEAMEKINVKMPLSGLAHSLDEAHSLLDKIGLPVILRPSFTLGGGGGGVCYNREDYNTMVKKALSESPTNQVLIDQSVIGWKEFEVEVMRDLADNVVIVCSIENLDPMGVHTGDSITLAPQQTLTDSEYQKLRNMSIDIIREIGVETGGSNIQFAVSPENGEILVIEMNPRVSRSSALASKATGFPIAKIAAKLSVGYTLDEIKNDITRETPASFEPSIDYIVTKVPRYTFEKFPESARTLDTQMRSVGEAMALGRTFPESFQKALRSLENSRWGWGADGHWDIPLEVLKAKNNDELEDLLNTKLITPNDERIFYIREALLAGKNLEEIRRLTKIDLWFLHHFFAMLDMESRFVAFCDNDNINLEAIQEMKENGYCDRQLGTLKYWTRFSIMLEKLVLLKKGTAAHLAMAQEMENMIRKGEKEIRFFRESQNFFPVFKRVDTCAGEFQSFTPYLYSSFGSEDESQVSDKEKVLILGGGPNRIGQGIEFDYCCCHAAYALTEMGYESIMVNSNPETVSTDYDTSDRLYFEPLTTEDILNIVYREKMNGKFLGVILQFGGQTPLKLSKSLKEAGIPILGTDTSSIDRAEDRKLFNELITKLGLRQPNGKMAAKSEEAITAAAELGYPVLVRPSFVLGGRAMMIVHNEEQLQRYMQLTTEISPERPILIDTFLQNATEIDVDALCDGNDVFIAGILEHIEEAGVHSGDSACILPPKDISETLLKEIRTATRQMALELNVIGCINIQFAIYNNELYVIEVNPRASRTVPFISKAINVPLSKMATQILMGKTLKELSLIEEKRLNLYYVKEAVLPFKKFVGVDTILGPEMKSTGEVMGIGKTPAEAFNKAQEAAGQKLPKKGKIFISVADHSKMPLIDPLKQLGDEYTLLATKGTAKFLDQHGISATMVNKVKEGRPHIVDLIKSGEIDLIVNTPTDNRTRNDALEIRLAALQYNIPYFTTSAAAREAIYGLIDAKSKPLEVYPIG